MTCDVRSFGYLPLAGTNGWRDGWCTRDDHPFALMMASEGFRAVRRKNGTPWRWSTLLDGVFGDDQVHIDASEHLADFLDAYVPYEDRNLIAHSHGGNVAIRTALDLPIRSLTTVGTPVRPDLDYQAACNNIGFWQHLYDRRWDLMGWLGKIKIFDGQLQLVDAQRSFHVKPREPGSRNRGMINVGLDGVSHSNLLRDDRFHHYWKVNGWLTNIRLVPGPLVASL